MMPGVGGLSLRNRMTVLLVAAVGTLVGCGSDPPPPPDLVPQAAAAAIAERWSQEQMNHFKSDLPFRRPGRMRRKERSLEAGGSDGSQRQCLDDDISFDGEGHQDRDGDQPQGIRQRA